MTPIIWVKRSSEPWSFGQGNVPHHWEVGPTPEESRHTHWPTWEKAMRWATDPNYRAREVATDSDSGW